MYSFSNKNKSRKILVILGAPFHKPICVKESDSLDFKVYESLHNFMCRNRGVMKVRSDRVFISFKSSPLVFLEFV